MSENELKQELDQQIAKNKETPKGTVTTTKVFPSEFSGKRSNVAGVATYTKKAVPSSTARQQVDYYLNQLSNYIKWTTSSDADPLTNKASFFPSITKTFTFQAAKPKEDQQKGGKKKRKTRKGSRKNKNKTRKQK
jgi:hypothetical protein